jgi:hypothetical protein
VIVAAYSLSIPTQRYGERKQELLDAALETAAKVGERSGRG